MRFYGALVLLLLAFANCALNDIRDEASAMDYLENVEKGKEMLDSQFITKVWADWMRDE